MMPALQKVGVLGFALFLHLHTTILAQAQPKWTASDIYKDCGSETKICFGDTDTCIETKNCIFVASARENTTHLTAEIQDSCNSKAETTTFFGVGATTISKNVADKDSKYTCTPKLQDFKFVILRPIQEEKCSSNGEVKKNWGFLKKGILANCEVSPPANLTQLVTSQMIVHSGNVPTDIIDAKNYTAKFNGAFFTNSSPIQSPSRASILIPLAVMQVLALLIANALHS